MKYLIPVLIIALTLPFSAGQAATPAQEKAFVEAYKKAFEAGDKKALSGFLYTEGAGAEQIEFFQMMQMMDPGAKVSSIQLVTPSAEDAKEFNEPMTMPDGKSFVLGLKPTKQLVIVSETKNANGSSKSTSKVPVAEKNGKLVIPVPVPAKK
jgi:hypothetical protein